MWQVWIRNSRTFRYSSIFALCLLTTFPVCLEARAQGPLANFEKRWLAPKAEADETQLLAVERLKRAAEGEIRVEFDPVLGIPSAIYARSGSLREPAPLGDPEAAVKGFLDANRDLYGFGGEILQSARLRENVASADPHGFHTIRWQQELDGIAVFHGLMTGILTRQGKLINFCSLFVPNVEAASGMNAEQRSAIYGQPAVPVKEALILAADNLGDRLTLDEIVVTVGNPAQPAPTFRLRSPDLKGEASATLVWLPTSRVNIRLCWKVVLMNNADADLFSLLVDAETGEIQARHSRTSHFQIQPVSYRVYTGESPTPFLPAYSSSGNPNQPINLGTLAPEYVNQTPIENFGVVSTDGSPNGWIDPGDNRTRGNNVDAYWDPQKFFDSGPPLPDNPNRPEGSAPRVFYYMADPAREPTYVGEGIDNPKAAVVNAFYWANWMHDKLWDLGFTELHGNFQSNNFGRGGLENDRVHILVQHGAMSESAN